MAHTKGPWRAINLDEDRYFPSVEIGMRGNRPDRIAINAGGGPMEEHRANARLIAAAPDMLEELKRLLKHLHNPSKKHTLQSAAFKRVNALINKATGLTPDPPSSKEL